MEQPIPGEIRAFGVSDEPGSDAIRYLREQGWLPAKGQLLKTEAYPELFAMIGRLWGLGDAETTFNAPNLRGQFLRGTSFGDETCDPDIAKRANADGTPEPKKVGSFQAAE